MIYPPIAAVCAADSTVLSLLGPSPVRFYMFGEAPAGTAKPYAVWQTIGGFPENYLGTAPDADNWSVQVDVYADTGASARSVATAIRNAIQPHAYVTSWNGEGREGETNDYRIIFSVDWITKR